MQLWQYCLLVTARLLYMFRTLSASTIRMSVATAVATDLGHPHWIYIIPTHDMHQWLQLQFQVLLMMYAESVRNMQSNLAVTNKQYCQSCILLVLYIIYCKIKFNNFEGHKIVLNACFCPCFIQSYIALHFLTLIFILFGFIL